MIPEEVPQELIDILDRRAGKEHSRTGSVVSTLAEILTCYDGMKSIKKCKCSLMDSADLPAVRDRWSLARMAGEDATDAGRGWDDAKMRAVLRSWQDIPKLIGEVSRLREHIASH